MFKRTIVLIITLIYCLMPGAALQQDLSGLVDQYFNNANQIKDLNEDETRLKDNISGLNNSLVRSQEQIKNVDNNIKVLNSEIAALELNIQENKNKINETERNMRLMSALKAKESLILLGVLTGAIAGLWVTSLGLVLLWRR